MRGAHAHDNDDDDDDDGNIAIQIICQVQNSVQNSQVESVDDSAESANNLKFQTQKNSENNI